MCPVLFCRFLTKNLESLQLLKLLFANPFLIESELIVSQFLSSNE